MHYTGFVHYAHAAPPPHPATMPAMAQTLILITDESDGTIKVQFDQTPPDLDPRTPAQHLSALLETHLRAMYAARTVDDVDS